MTERELIDNLARLALGYRVEFEFEDRWSIEAGPSGGRPGSPRSRFRLDKTTDETFETVYFDGVTVDEDHGQIQSFELRKTGDIVYRVRGIDDDLGLGRLLLTLGRTER